MAHTLASLLIMFLGTDPIAGVHCFHNCYLCWSLHFCCAGWDSSAILAGQLTTPVAIPPINELQDFLCTSPQQPLPVSPAVMAQLQADPPCQPHLLCFTDQHTAAMLSEHFMSVLRFQPLGLSEPWTADIVNRTVMSTLQQLDQVLPISRRAGFVLERKGDSTSGMTLLSERLRSLRPDGVIRHRDLVRLLFKWEERGAGEAHGRERVQVRLVWCRQLG